MDKNGILFIILIVLIVGLAASTSYLFLNKEDNTSSQPKNLTQTILSGSEDTENKELPEKKGLLPTNPMIVYEVAAGDTLNPIGLKFDINWTHIAKLNNIKEPFIIYKGKILFIPQRDEISGVVKVNFGIDKEKTQEFQDKIKTSKAQWADPEAVAKLGNAGVAALNSDKASFKLASLDETSGKAHVTAVLEDRSFDIFLTQPLGLGKEKIWVINYIGELQ